MVLRVQGTPMRRHLKREWLVFFGNPSHTLLPIFGLKKLWRMVMHLIRCQACADAIPWPRPFRGNVGAPAQIPGMLPRDEFYQGPPAPPNTPRRRYRRRVYGTRGWRRHRLDPRTGRRSGRLRRVAEGLAGLGARWIERQVGNGNDGGNNDGVIGNALGE